VRFRQLLRIEDAERDRLYTAGVRLVRYLGGRVDPRSLVVGFFYWNDRTRHDWARNYYFGGAATAAA